MEHSEPAAPKARIADPAAHDQDQAEREYRRMREILSDYHSRQEFEHSLINRRTTWLLTSQTILFAAYGVTLLSEEAADVRELFRIVIGVSGVLIAGLVFIGVFSAIQAKRRSWKDYRKYFAARDPHDHPEFARGKLDWGVRRKITERSLILDKALPFVFIGAWALLVISEVVDA